MSKKVKKSFCFYLFQMHFWEAANIVAQKFKRKDQFWVAATEIIARVIIIE